MEGLSNHKHINLVNVISEIHIVKRLYFLVFFGFEDCLYSLTNILSAFDLFVLLLTFFVLTFIWNFYENIFPYFKSNIVWGRFLLVLLPQLISP
eukprot:UN10448